MLHHWCGGFRPSRHTLREMRTHTAAMLAQWGADSDVCDSMRLIVSEVTTYSVQRTQSRWSTVEVGLTHAEATVRITSQGCPRRLEPARAETENELGWGLMLVEALASRWTQRETDWGHTIIEAAISLAGTTLRAPMPSEHTSARNRALSEEVSPRRAHDWPPDLVRVSSHGRLRPVRPRQQTMWTMPADACDLPRSAFANVQQTLIGWGVSLPDASHSEAQASRLCEAATVYPGARRAVILALDGIRLTMGVLMLTRQILDTRGDLEDPGLIEAVQAHPSGAGVLRLPMGLAVYRVRSVNLAP
ncbi:MULTISPECIES: ATP-binding protein [unclassified Streptomyces]